ncbi:MAG: hypothetical protein ABIR55_14900 [Burkholderiaceae bacterium]
MDDTASTPFPDPIGNPPLTRQQARRLRDIHRSAGWPTQDALEIDLLAAGLLLRVMEPGASERLRLSDIGIQRLACALQRNRQALNAHNGLVAKVAQVLLRDGRLVWSGLSLRALLQPAADATLLLADPDAAAARSAGAAPLPDFALDAARKPPSPARWRVCKPDLFSIRNTTMAAYLQPVVHEIKVSRADLLGDLRLPDKRASYLDLGGQCWYVLGCDGQGRPIAQAHEIPDSCGVLVAQHDGALVVERPAPHRVVKDLPFAVWMALAKTTPLSAVDGATGDGEPDQGLLVMPASMRT